VKGLGIGAGCPNLQSYRVDNVHLETGRPACPITQELCTAGGLVLIWLGTAPQMRPAGRVIIGFMVITLQITETDSNKLTFALPGRK